MPGTLPLQTVFGRDRALPDTVYAHTSQTLHALDVKTLTLNLISNFSFDNFDDHSITDIAFDRSGVMWAVSFDSLWICHPRTGECRRQGFLPSQFNGLTFIPGELFGELRDMLIGISVEGDWHRLSVSNGLVESMVIGSYLIDTSSGDAFSIDGVGTYAAVNREGVADDIIITVDPQNLSQTSDVITLNGYTRVFGLAGVAWPALRF